MSNTGALNAIEYEAETAWGENVTTFATHRIPNAIVLDTSKLTQDRIDSTRQQQQVQGVSPYILGPIDGSFSMRIWLTGHGSTTSGATTLDPMETFLGYVFGNPGDLTEGAKVSAASGTTAAAGSTTTSVNTVASGTFLRGALTRIGTGGITADGRGSGQFYPINNHTATVMALLLGTITAANAADVIYSAVNFYLPETAANTAVKGLRFRLLTANQRYECHGCYPTNAKIAGLNPGEVPYIEIEWGVSWWTTSTGTFPSVVASNAYNPSPCTGGSLVVQDVGTATRAARVCRSFSIDINLGIVPLPGPGGVNPYQKIVGARRTPSTIMINWTEDAEAAGTASLDAKFLAGTAQQILYSCSVTAGSALAFYARNAQWCGKRPVQSNQNGINTVSAQMCAAAGTDLATDLSQSALVIGYA